MKPWVCPKCSRVWGPLVDQCRPCNVAVAARSTMPQWMGQRERAKIALYR